MIPTPQTFASHVTVCAKCGRGVQTLYLNEKGQARITPCGHEAKIECVPNKLLPPV